MAMRLAGRAGVDWVTTTLGSGTTVLGAIAWGGDHGVIAALATLLGALSVVVGLIFRTLFAQIRELRDADEQWRRRETEWRAERDEMVARITHLEAVIARAGIDA